MIEFMAITNDPRMGFLWHAAGVDRIMIDLETYGKADRQRHRDTVKSDHAIADIPAMKKAAPSAHIVVRCEPVTMPRWNDHIEAVLECNPTSVMLPMVRSRDHVEVFRDAVGDRAQLIVMIETSSALASIEHIVEVAPTATYFVGLNDLHVELGYRFMFEPLANGDVDVVAEAAHAVGAGFGFGGLARVGQGLVDSAMVVKEHVRLGSRLAILSRSFFGGLADAHDVNEIRREIGLLRAVEQQAATRSREDEASDQATIRETVSAVAAELASST